MRRGWSIGRLFGLCSDFARLSRDPIQIARHDTDRTVLLCLTGGVNWTSVLCCDLCLLLVFTARCYASAVLAVGLCTCPCPCLSVTSRCSTKTAKRRITQTTPHDSPGTLVFWCQRSPRNSTGITPCGAPNTGGVGQNRRLSTNSWLYLENGTR